MKIWDFRGIRIGQWRTERVFSSRPFRYPEIVRCSVPGLLRELHDPWPKRTKSRRGISPHQGVRHSGYGYNH